MANASGGVPLPQGWHPAAGSIKYARDSGLTSDQILECIEQMSNWARANQHRSIAHKSDWNATFRSWVYRFAQEKWIRRRNVQIGDVVEGRRHKYQWDGSKWKELENG